MFNKQASIVVSEPDILAAINHLNSLPYSKLLPQPWDRQHFLNSLRDALGQKPKINDAIAIAPGVFGVVKPFGVDIAGWLELQHRLQVWIAIRSVGTDTEHVTEL